MKMNYSKRSCEVLGAILGKFYMDVGESSKTYTRTNSVHCENSISGYKHRIGVKELSYKKDIPSPTAHQM